LNAGCRASATPAAPPYDQIVSNKLQRWGFTQRPSRRAVIEAIPGSRKEESKDFLLIAALDHAWRWHDLRINCGLQILNFYLLAIAVLIAAYGSALNARNYTVSVAVALVGAAVTASTYMVGARQDHVARMALASIKEIESRLAAGLEIDSIRLVERYQAGRKLSAYAVRGIAISYTQSSSSFASPLQFMRHSISNSDPRPGRVIVELDAMRLRPRARPPAHGRLTVSCRTASCRSRWFQPCHDPDSQSWEPGRPGGHGYCRA
jgi:hypothetical protein